MAAIFNPAQLATFEQARELAAEMNSRGVGGGVRPETGDMATSGIYTEPWLPGPQNFQEPGGVDPKTGKATHPILLRFNNGAAGINVGLVLDKFKRYPMSPWYVWDAITREVNSMVFSD